jgi:hypothetical protein
LTFEKTNPVCIDYWLVVWLRTSAKRGGGGGGGGGDQDERVSASLSNFIEPWNAEAVRTL